MKPRLESKVYCKIEYQIIEERVGYLGTDEFIIYYDSCTDIKYIKYSYDAYGVTWFKTLKEAKASYDIEKDEHFVKYQHNGQTWWELEVKA